jgi:dTDP-4-dehydrorhamnose 3,5-epimerase
MKFSPTPLFGSYLIDLEPRGDERGFFARYFCEQEFAANGLNTRWVQINNSLSTESGTLRGLHFQRPPHAEVKLVRCLKGAIWDVIVDLREDSETYGQWFGAELSASNRTMMYVPEGFAHGFVSLLPDSEILYLVSEFYTPEAEGTLLWNDPVVGIKWPITPVVISDKDANGKPFIEPADD